MVAVNCYLWQGSEHPYGTEYVKGAEYTMVKQGSE